MSLRFRLLAAIAAGAVAAAATWLTPFRAWWWLAGGIAFVWVLSGKFPDLA
jgi:hypothetical protein